LARDSPSGGTRNTARQIALHHHRLAVDLGVHFQQRIQIVVARPQMNDPGPAIAKQRLQNDLAMLLPEGTDRLGIEGQQRRRHQLLEVQRKQLLRRIAHRRWIVDHQRPVFRQQFQEMGRGDVGHVEWRVLPHQDHVEAVERELF
jgi:hypothetical protein